MTVFNFRVKAIGSDKTDFYQEIIQVNHYRSRNLSLLLFPISLVALLLIDRPNLQKGFETVGDGYRGLFYLHAIFALCMLVFLGSSWLKARFPSPRITRLDKLFDMSFCFTLAIMSALFSVNDQLIHGEITLYILGLFTVAIVNYLRPLNSLIIYLLSYTVFIFGIATYQNDFIILREHVVNSAILIIVAWFLSTVLYYTKLNEFVNRRTIDRQKNQLEQANIELTAANYALRESLNALDESQNMIFTLTLALESKDRYTRGHSERVAEYSLSLANHLGLDEEDKITLWRAAILHDTGKIGIPDAILNKSTKLSEEEWNTMKSHPERGETICSKLKFAREILPIIRHHHERYDGTGYPDGLRGDNIPKLARIVAIADMVDAVTSQRPYRAAQTLDLALQELKTNAGTQFDPEFAAAFVDLYKGKNLKSS